jgi:D-glucosaminate-specific PTS system IIB component
MGNLALVRIDSRLIHGQVVVDWIRTLNVDRVIIVDDHIFADPFMTQIFKMAAPPKVKVEIMGKEKAVADWQTNQFGSGNLMVLFRDVPTAYGTYKLGFDFSMLQVGGIGGAPGRVAVVGPVTLSKEDASLINEMAQNGCVITFRVLPLTQEVDWEKVKSKYFAEL